MTLVTNAAELSTAFAAASPGDLIEMAPGAYGSVSLSRVFTAPVTLRSQDPANPAQITWLSIRDARNIVIDGLFLKYTHAAGDVTWIKPFELRDSTFITIRNCIVEGDEVLSATGGNGSFGFGYGLYSEFCDDVVFEFCEVYNFERAVNMGSGSRLVFRGNDLHDCRSEGVDHWNVHGLLVEGNYFHDFKKDPSTGDHPDMIQFWNVKVEEWSEDVTIRGNFLNAGPDWTQSIFIQNGSFDGTKYFRNFLVEHNVIYNAHLHGITCEGGFDGLVIRHNTLLYDPAASDPTNNADFPPFINVNIGNLNVTIEGNIVEKTWNWDVVTNQPGWVVGDNFFVQRSDPAGVNYYGDVFVNALMGGASLADLRAVAGGLIETTGVGADMTRMGGLLNAGPAPGSDPAPAPEPEINLAVQAALDALSAQIAANAGLVVTLDGRVLSAETAAAALGTRLTVAEAVASIHTTDIAAALARITVVEAAGVAGDARMASAEIAAAALTVRVTTAETELATAADRRTAAALGLTAAAVALDGS